MSGLVQAGAFVVQFRPGSDFAAGRVQGRLEHVASGHTAHFESADELLELVALGLKRAHRVRDPH